MTITKDEGLSCFLLVAFTCIYVGNPFGFWCYFDGQVSFCSASAFNAMKFVQLFVRPHNFPLSIPPNLAQAISVSPLI